MCPTVAQCCVSASSNSWLAFKMCCVVNVEHRPVCNRSSWWCRSLGVICSRTNLYLAANDVNDHEFSLSGLENKRFCCIRMYFKLLDNSTQL